MEATANTAVKQSRVGKRPISVPKGVEIQVAGNLVTVKGPKGAVAREMPAGVAFDRDGDVVTINAGACGKEAPRLQGLARALLQAQVKGAAEGFHVAMDLHGVGYRAEVKGDQLQLALGLSHGVTVPIPDEIKVRVEIIDVAGTKRPRIHLESVDKVSLGQFRSRLRALRPPEPYKGKGIRQVGERIREKAGKAGAKK